MVHARIEKTDHLCGEKIVAKLCLWSNKSLILMIPIFLQIKLFWCSNLMFIHLFILTLPPPSWYQSELERWFYRNEIWNIGNDFRQATPNLQIICTFILMSLSSSSSCCYLEYRLRAFKELVSSKVGEIHEKQKYLGAINIDSNLNYYPRP